MRVRQIAIALVWCAAAWAGTDPDRALFQCGSYALRGKLRLPADEKVAPVLLLWEKTLSETRIPVRVAADLRARLAAMGQEDVLGEFDVRIPAPGRWPRYAILDGFHFPDSKSLNEPMKPRLLKAEKCEAEK